MTVTVDLIIQIIAIFLGIGSLVVLTYLRFLVPPTTGLRYALVIVLAFTINYFFGIIAFSMAPGPASAARYTVTVSVQLLSMLLLMFYSLRFVEVLGRPRYAAVVGAARAVLVVLIPAFILQRFFLVEPGFHVVDAVTYLFVTMSALIFSVYYLVHRRKEATEALSTVENSSGSST